MQRLMLVDDIDQESPAVTRTITLDGTAYEIDLSDENHALHVGPLQALLSKHGRPVSLNGTAAAASKRRANGVTVYQCEHPGCAEGFSHGTKRAAHYRKDHPGWIPPGKTAPPTRKKPQRAKASTAKKPAKKAAAKRPARKSAEAPATA